MLSKNDSVGFYFESLSRNFYCVWKWGFNLHAVRYLASFSDSRAKHAQSFHVIVSNINPFVQQTQGNTIHESEDKPTFQ